MAISIEGISFSSMMDDEGNSLPIIEINNKYCQAVIAYQGAQILSFKPKIHQVLQDDLLWCSEKSCLNGKKAIRGGIPLCFPWFGDHASVKTYPAHGFARQQTWQLVHIRYDENHQHQLIFSLEDNEFSHRYWPHPFKLSLSIQCGATLQLELAVHNTGDTAFDFTFAWHSYFNVSEISQTKIIGLEETIYLDKLAPEKGFQDQVGAIEFSAETDRIYPHTMQDFDIQSVNRKNIKVQSLNCASAVVWNPWLEKTSRLTDLKADDWHHFVCLESGNLLDEIQTVGVNTIKTYQLTIKQTTH